MGRRRIGFTNRAGCLLAAGATAIVCGLVLGEPDLVRAGVLAVAIPCAAAVLVRRARVRITSRRWVEPRHAQAGEPVVVHLVVTNQSMLRTGTLLLEDHVPSQLPGRARFVLDPLGGRESRSISYRLPGLARGAYRVGPLRMRLSDPFRMIDLGRSFSTSSQILVAPVTEQLAAAELPGASNVGESLGSDSLGTHGADDQSTREYRIGDDLRKIHWRSSARMGVLMVRQTERPWRGQSTVVLDLRAVAHERFTDEVPPSGADARRVSSVEWAISAAASTGVHLLRHNGAALSLLTDNSAVHRFADPAPLLSHLAAAGPSPEQNLARLGAGLRSAAGEGSILAVLGRLDPTSLRALREAGAHSGATPACAMLLDTSSWSDPRATGPGSEAETSAAALRSTGWRVVVVHRGMDVGFAWRALLASDAVALR